MATENTTDIPKDRESVKSLDSTGKQKSFRRLFARFGEKTSMQGVPYIYLAKLWWAKAIWSVLLLGAVVVMGLHLWFLFDQWYSWPIDTKVELGFQPLEFPQVTICNTNIMHKTRFENFPGAEALKLLVEQMRPENLVSEQFEENYTYSTETPTTEGQTTEADDTLTTPAQNGDPANIRRKRYIKEFEKINISNYDNEDDYEDDYYDDDDYYHGADKEFLSQLRAIVTQEFMDIYKDDREILGHSIYDMLVECTFNGRKCTADQFELHQTSQYGNCWTISDKKFKVRKAGPLTGLSLTLFLETNEYLEGIANGYGVRVSVQQRNTYPFPADEGIFIPASMESDIALKLINVTRLGGNFGKCNDGVEFKQVYNMSYTRRACQSFCQMSTVIKNCSCYDDDWEEFAFYNNQKLKPCRTSNENKCMRRIQSLYFNNSLTCVCDNPCNEYSYTQEMSQRQWPSNEYARVLLEWVCDNDIGDCKSLRADLNDLWTVNNNFLKLNIYYKDLNYEKITETPQIEIQQFLSDVGGAVGLWIGLSVLSFCELIQLIMELCYYAGHKINKFNRRSKKSRDKLRQGRTFGTEIYDIQKDKENRWPYRTRSLSNDKGYHSDSDKRYHNERHNRPRHTLEDPRDHYDDIRDRYSDFRESRRYDSPYRSYY